MSFSDIFRKSFLDGFTGADISVVTASSAMLITAFIGLYIFVVYRVLTRRTFYSKSFNISLAAVAVITAAIILTIQSSIVVSLGMVGALSIVRFRTAVKEPMDLVFLFWSIAAGIICGVGLAEIAVVLSLIITVGIVVLDRIPVAKAPQILVVSAAGTEAEKPVLAVVEKYAKHSAVKARNMTQDSLDMTIELRTGAGSDLLKEVLGVEGVTSASMLAHDGEVTF